MEIRHQEQRASDSEEEVQITRESAPKERKHTEGWENVLGSGVRKIDSDSSVEVNLKPKRGRIVQRRKFQEAKRVVRSKEPSIPGKRKRKAPVKYYSKYAQTEGTKPLTAEEELISYTHIVEFFSEAYGVSVEQVDKDFIDSQGDLEALKRSLMKKQIQNILSV